MRGDSREFFPVHKMDAMADFRITKRHWMPAVAVRNCSNPNCGLKFTSYLRKHHCRSCGNVFCTTCASFSMPVDPATCQVTRNGIWAKVCLLCYECAVEDGFGQDEEYETSEISEKDSEDLPPNSLEEAVFGRRPKLQRSISAIESEYHKQGLFKSASVSNPSTEPEIFDNLKELVSIVREEKPLGASVSCQETGRVQQENIISSKDKIQEETAIFFESTSQEVDNPGDVVVRDDGRKCLIAEENIQSSDSSLVTRAYPQEKNNSSTGGVVAIPYRSQPLSRSSVFEVPVFKGQLVRGNSLPSGYAKKIGNFDLPTLGTSTSTLVRQGSGTLVKDKLVKCSITKGIKSIGEGDVSEKVPRNLDESIHFSVIPKIHHFNQFDSWKDDLSGSPQALGRPLKKLTEDTAGEREVSGISESRSNVRLESQVRARLSQTAHLGRIRDGLRNADINVPEPNISEKLKDLCSLWENRVSSQRPAAPPIIRSKSAKVPKILGLMTKSNGDVRFLVPSPLRNQNPLHRHSYVPQAPTLVRTRTSVSERALSLSPSPSPSPLNHNSFENPILPDVLQESISLSAGMASGNSTNLTAQSISKHSSEINGSVSLGKGRHGWETRRRLIDDMDAAETITKDKLMVKEIGYEANEKNIGTDRMAKLVTNWSVRDVGDWLEKNVPLSAEKLPEFVESFEKAKVNGSLLLGLQREDPPCSMMLDADWSALKVARRQLIGSETLVTTGKSPPGKLSRSGQDLTIDVSPGGSSAPSPYSPRSPAFSETALWSPVISKDRNRDTNEPDNMSNWLWGFVGSGKSEKQVKESEVKTVALHMEVQTLRGEIVASEEREATVRAQLIHLDEGLRNANLAEYMPTRMRWEALPGEIAVPDGDVDDWLPRFVVLNGSTLSFYLRASDLHSQGTVSLRSSVKVGRMEHSEHSAGNDDGQWKAFFVLSEHGMRLECSIRNHHKFELWLECIEAAMGRE